MFNKQDYAISALVGFLTGTFAIPTLVNLGIRNLFVLIPLPLAAAIAFYVGIWFAGVLSRWLSFLAQLGKFIAVGFLNTAIDFGILNLLSGLTGVTAGLIVGGVNMPGFTVAVINSYFWNKFWVFRGGGGAATDFPKFIAVSVGGLLLNSGVVVLVTTYVSIFTGFGSSAWLNFAKFFATVLVFVWNFLGYKFLVFRSRP